MDIYKCPKLKREKKILKNTTFSRSSYHNALIFIFGTENIVSMGFFADNIAINNISIN
jgi:hypothetical protein